MESDDGGSSSQMEDRPPQAVSWFLKAVGAEGGARQRRLQLARILTKTKGYGTHSHVSAGIISGKFETPADEDVEGCISQLHQDVKPDLAVEFHSRHSMNSVEEWGSNYQIPRGCRALYFVYHFTVSKPELG
jgi:hypothetical protein